MSDWKGSDRPIFMYAEEKKEEIHRFPLRWPKSVKDKIVKRAKKENRSINGQIVHECDKREVK